MKTMIKYVPKQKLYPAFGDADIKKQAVYIRNDLPNSVKIFVKEHELYHLKDKTNNWILREITASVYAGLRHPLGFLMTVIMSLQPYRIKFYVQRIKKGE